MWWLGIQGRYINRGRRYALRTTDEHAGKYAWRGTLYSMPGKLIPWWQLPIDETVRYSYEDVGEHTVRISLTTATGNTYDSLVTTDRGIALLTQMREAWHKNRQTPD